MYVFNEVKDENTCPAKDDFPEAMWLLRLIAIIKTLELMIWAYKVFRRNLKKTLTKKIVSDAEKKPEA